MEAGKQGIAEFLISRGADVNKKTFAGNTALHTASGRDMEYMVKLLMQNGANVNIANREGDIPRVVRTSEQVIRLLCSSIEPLGMNSHSAEEKNILFFPILGKETVPI